MESIIEFMVKKQAEVKDKVKKVLIIVLAALLVCAGFYFMGSYGLLVAVLVIFLASRVVGMLDVEFEYCIIGADIQIDKIMNRSKRKAFLTIEAGNIDVIAPVGSPQLDNFVRKDTKTINCAKRADDPENFAVVTATSKGHCRVLICVDDRIKEQFKKALPRKYFDC